MATIQLSTAVKNNLASALWQPNLVTANLGAGPSQQMLFANMVYSGAGSNTGIHIMQGSVPSNFTTLTSFNSRASDVLVTFCVRNPSPPGDFASASYVDNVYTMNTALKQAIATGTATWFWITNYDVDPAGLLLQQIIGTVGTIGSGADLEIQTTSIVTGSPYRVSNLVFVMPDSWTV
jgi:hypothetical protein